MSDSVQSASAAKESLSSEFNEIVRRIDDDRLGRAMSDPWTKAVVLGAVFAEMPGRLVGARVRDVEALVRFRIGNPAAEWNVDVSNGGCSVRSGRESAKAAVTLELSEVSFLRLISGEASGMAMMMTGRLRVKGSVVLARKIESWFARE